MNKTTKQESAGAAKQAAATPESPRSVRWLAIVPLCLLPLAYTLAVVLGYVPEKQRIDTPNLVLLALAGACTLLIFRPNLLRRITKFKMGDMEWELDTLKQQQERQAEQLDAINFLLPLFFRGNETKQLQALAAKQTRIPEGSETLRKELRNLAKMGLVERLPNRKIADISDKRPADLADFVRLTDFGRRWVEKFNAIDGDKDGAQDE